MEKDKVEDLSTECMIILKLLIPWLYGRLRALAFFNADVHSFLFFVFIS
jgi:hypothetical protein